MGEFVFLVDQIRTFSSPDGVKRYLLQVPVRALPDNLPLDVNARRQSTRTGVAKAIQESLLASPDIFHLLNRGMVIAAKELQYDPKTSRVTLCLEDTTVHGVLDGGHTYTIIREDTPPDSTAKVMVEVLTGVEDYQAEIVEARNTAVPVEAAALANVRREFDPILDWLDSHGLSKQRIRVKQFDREAEIPILEILSIMHLFDIDHYGNDVEGFDRAPVRAYSQKSTILKHFQGSEHTKVYTHKMLPLLPDILWLWDYLALNPLEHYRAGTGKDTGRFGLRTGNQTGPVRGTYLDLDLHYTIHKAYRLPLMAATRCLVVEKSGQYCWKEVALPTISENLEGQLGRRATQLERFYELVAPKLHGSLWAVAENATPNKIGKSLMLWCNLYTIAWREMRSRI